MCGGASITRHATAPGVFDQERTGFVMAGKRALVTIGCANGATVFNERTVRGRQQLRATCEEVVEKGPGKSDEGRRWPMVDVEKGRRGTGGRG